MLTNNTVLHAITGDLQERIRAARFIWRGIGWEPPAAFRSMMLHLEWKISSNMKEVGC